MVLSFGIEYVLHCTYANNTTKMRLPVVLLTAAAAVRAIVVDPVELIKAVFPGTEEGAAAIGDVPPPGLMAMAEESPSSGSALEPTEQQRGIAMLSTDEADEASTTDSSLPSMSST